MARGIVQKDHNFSVLFRHFFTKFINPFIKNHRCHPRFFVIPPKDVKRLLAHVLAFPIMRQFSFSPSILHNRAIVSRCLHIFPPLHFSFFNCSDRVGVARKNKPVSSKLKIFFGSYGPVNLCNVSRYFSTTFVSVDAPSPVSEINCRLWRSLKLWSQPFDAVNSVKFNCSPNFKASSCSI